jgi:hypothetical protein
MVDNEVDNESDHINHPKWYNNHPSGIETIDVAEQLNFVGGSVIKYLMRAGLKEDTLKDYKKALWYVERRLTPREHHPIILIQLLERLIQTETNPFKRALLNEFLRAQRIGVDGYVEMKVLLNARLEKE